MHKVIRLIVYAKDENDAVASAEGVMQDVCGEGRLYDWYSLFTDNTKNSTSGIGRWGKLPLVTSANSKIGKELIDEGWNFTKEETKEALSELRKKTKDMTDEDIDKLIKNHDSELEYLAYKVSDEDNTSYLYDNDGTAIRDEDHLNKTLNKWNNPEYEKLKVYVVPVDVHW